MIATDALPEATVRAVAGRSLAEVEAIIRDVIELASAWAAGAMPLEQIRELTTGQERFLVARFTRPVPPEVKRMYDALIATDVAPGGAAYATRFGIILEHEARAWGARIERFDDGGVRITFPGGAR